MEGIEIATREYVCGRRTLRATLYKPTEEVAGVWLAKFRLSGLTKPIVGGIRGGDGLQAMLLAAQLLRVHLEQLGRELQWGGEDPGNTGIPRDIGWSYGLAFSKKMERLVEKEIVELLKLQARRRSARSKSPKTSLRRPPKAPTDVDLRKPGASDRKKTSNER